MSFLTASTDFNVIPYNLPAGTINNAAFPGFIEDMEEEALVSLLGVELYEEMQTELAEDYPAEPWLSLKLGGKYSYCDVTYKWAGLVKLLRPYVVARWFQSGWYTVDELGVTQAKAENAKILSPDDLIVKAFNDYTVKAGYRCNRRHSLYGFLMANETTFSKLVWTSPKGTNRFNV